MIESQRAGLEPLKANSFQNLVFWYYVCITTYPAPCEVTNTASDVSYTSTALYFERHQHEPASIYIRSFPVSWLLLLRRRCRRYCLCALVAVGAAFDLGVPETEPAPSGDGRILFPLAGRDGGGNGNGEVDETPLFDPESLTRCKRAE